jgi:hypothetical protein
MITNTNAMMAKVFHCLSLTGIPDAIATSIPLAATPQMTALPTIIDEPKLAMPRVTCKLHSGSFALKPLGT